MNVDGLFLAPVLAMAPAGGGQAGQGSDPLQMLPMIVIMLAIFYFMLIRPQQRKEKERKGMLEKVKSGDRILFAGGLLGDVTNAKNDKTLTVKIADGVKMEISRAAVNAILEKGETPDEIPA